MKLHEKILADLITAMKEQDAEKRGVLRLLKASLSNFAIEEGLDELDDDTTLKVIAKEAKKRKDSIEQFMAGGRDDLAEKERVELSILEKYLPEMLSVDDIEKVAKEVLDGIDTPKFGAVMGIVMSKLQGKADGNDVKKVIQKLLD